MSRKVADAYSRDILVLQMRTNVEIVLENLSHKLVFCMVDSFDDESVVLRKVEEASTLSRRPQLR